VCYSPDTIPSGTIYSYNVDDSKTPGGIKVRWKAQVVTGLQAAARYDARQAEAIREALTWAVKHQRSTFSAGHPMTSPGETEPAAPVPVAVLARTSTLYLQDPLSSLQRQFRSAEEWLPPGWYIAAYYWDVESGAIDIEDRSQGTVYKQFTAAGLPRDGGMAEMLA
jgi:hypothetical protein